MRSKRNSGPGEYVAAAVIWLFAVGLGYMLSRASWRAVAESHALRNGATAPAAVVSSVVVARVGAKGGTTYEPVVVFQFHDQGRPVTGSRLRPEPVSFFTQASAADYLSTLLSTPLTAHFQPGDAGRAVLDPRVGDETAIGLLIGSGIVSAATLALAIFPPRRKFPDDALPIGTVRTEKGYMTAANHGGPKAWLVLGFVGAGSAAALTWTTLISPSSSFDDAALALIAGLPPATAGVGLVLLKRLVPRSSGALVVDEDQQQLAVLRWSGRDREIVVPFAEIVRVSLKLRIRGQKGQPDQYSPVLHVIGEGAAPRELVLRRMVFFLANATEFAGWLREVLAIDPPVETS